MLGFNPKEGGVESHMEAYFLTTKFKTHAYKHVYFCVIYNMYAKYIIQYIIFCIMYNNHH